MSSPPSQPSIADAARLMDSLSLAQGSRCAPAMSSTARVAPRSISNVSDVLGHGPARGSLDSNHFSRTISDNGIAPPTDPCNANTDQRRIPSLPAEIIFQIATHLVSSSQAPLHCGTDVRPASFACKHSFPPYAPLSPASADLHALLTLSSATKSFRHTLVPLVWHTVVIRTPQHLPRLAALLQSYDTLCVRSTSPQQRRRSSFAEAPALRHPLPHIRSIVVAIPDKYMDVDQTYLLALLRAMDLAHTRQLEHVSWSAEAVPNPAIWPLLGPSLKSLELDGRTFYQGHRGMAGLERLESLTMVGYESTLLSSGVVKVFRAQSVGDAVEGEVSEVPEGAEREERRDRGQSVSPLVELQTSAAASPRQARHLYLDPQPQPPSPTTTRTRLTHLSLSTSKTSLLHQSPLTATRAFAGLTHLDIFPITPEPPLARALLSAAATLTHLRLVLDISGAFANYDRLWADLTGRMPVLEWLEVDPMPQQNTAPSFWGFVEQASG
ncbi:conserved hypothetical protein [Sporisorium reilianum SRZ2]|uniref:Uncharacterized protein n=1 Tax=Sporisorium reilianum (strain SRZ2) TaxID=999809 RepID=E6ZKN5_SPORE|nr:conserved hypothetical protein [Sporisorium reilianum SRZ2]